ELLLESPLTEEQGNQILSALNSIERLSKINHSLALLNKLENQEFSVQTPADLSQHVRPMLEDFSELIAMKSITLREEIAGPVYVLLHPALADVLVTNLLSNAIRHNIHGGDIYISLTAERLLIENTGKAPEMRLEEAFERSKRSKEHGDSVGSGLAIVKQTCEVSGLRVEYTYSDGRHRVIVYFSS